MLFTLIATAGLAMMLAALALFLRGPRRFQEVLEVRREDPFHAAWILSVAVILNLGTGLLMVAVILR